MCAWYHCQAVVQRVACMGHEAAPEARDKAAKTGRASHPTVFPQPHQASPQSRICDEASMAWNEIDSCSRPRGCQNGAGANYLGFTGLTILSSSRETSFSVKAWGERLVNDL